MKQKRTLSHTSFFWIDDYLRPRSTKTNLPGADVESIASHISIDEPHDEFSEPDNKNTDTDIDGMDGDDMRIHELTEKPAQKPSNSNKAKRWQADDKIRARKHPKPSIVEESSFS